MSNDLHRVQASLGGGAKKSKDKRRLISQEYDKLLTNVKIISEMHST